MSYVPILLLFVEFKKNDRRVVEGRKKSAISRLLLDVSSPSLWGTKGSILQKYVCYKTKLEDCKMVVKEIISRLLEEEGVSYFRKETLIKKKRDEDGDEDGDEMVVNGFGFYPRLLAPHSSLRDKDMQESKDPQVVSEPVMSAAKPRILNPNEFDLWKMRIEQYFLMTNYSFWEVILNGDSSIPTRVIDGVVQPVAPTTAEQRLARKNKLEAHEKRFGGNKETKKMNKTDLEDQSLDDLFNSLKIYEAEVKSSSSASTSTQNIAFVYSQNTDSTNESISAVASVSAASAKVPFSALPNVDTLSDDVIYSFFASQARRFLQRTWRNLGSNGTTSIGFDMSKVECYKFHKRGHFVREYMSPKDTRRNVPVETQKRNVQVETSTSNALVSQCDGVGSYDWSFQAKEEPTNYALMAFTSLSSSSSDNKVASCSKACTKSYVTLHPVYDRYQSRKGYHVVPPPYTGTFMPPKPDLVFHDAPTINETVHTAFNVEDWVFDSEDESKAKPTQNAPSFVYPPKHVKTPRPSVKPVEHPILADHLRKDIPKNHAQKGNNQHYARMTNPQPHRHVVPTSVLTKSWLVPLTAARPVTAVVPQPHVTRPRPAKNIVTKSHSPPRRTIHHKPSPTPSNFPHKVTTVKAPKSNPQQALTDKGVIDSSCSRHMTRNISYLSEFEALNGGYVSFGGNPKGRKITSKGKIRICKLDFDDVYFVKELKFNLFSVSQMCDKKNNVLFTDTEWIKREFSVARTPQQNSIAKRKNMTLIKAARTMQQIHYYPFHFGLRTPSIGFMRPFGCPLTILNTLDPVGKFDRKADEGFLVGYSVSSKAFRVFNSRTRVVQETLHINFLENKPNVVGSGLTWLFDIDTLTNSMNYQPVIAGNQPNPSAGVQELFDAEKAGEGNEHEFEVKQPKSEVHVSPSSSAKTKKHDDKTKREAKGKNLVELSTRDDEEDVGAKADFSNFETNITVSPIPTTRVHKDHPISQIIGDLSFAPLTRSMKRMVIDQGGLTQINNDDFYTYMFAFFLSQEEPKRVHQALKDPSWIEAMQEELLQFKMQKFWVLIDLLKGKRAIGFEDPDYPNKVYKVVKALYGLHQAPRAWYETLANYLLENDFQKGKIDQKLFIKRQKGLQVKQKPDGIFISQDKYVAEILRKFGLTDGKSASTPIDTKKPLLKDPDGEDVDVYKYRSMIGSLMYLTSSRPDIMFAVCTCACFQVTPKALHLHVVKRIFRYLKGKPHLGLWYPKDSPFNLVAYSDSDYTGASLNMKSTIGGCQFFGCRLISWQCKKQTVVATSSTEAKYVAAASCYAQVLWIQNQLLDYGVGKGFSRVETPLFVGILVPQQAVDDVANVVADDVVTKDVAEPTLPSPTPTTQPPPPQELLSTSQVRTAQRIESSTDIVIDDQEDASKQEGIIAELDADKDVTLEEVDTAKDAEIEKNADVQGRQEESQAQVYHIDLEHANKVLSMQDDEPEPAELKEVKRKEKEDNAVLRYQSLKRRPGTEAQARKNMMVYLKNMVEFKMDFFKGMSYNDILLIFKKYLNSNVAFLEKSKEQLEEEESRALKRKTESSKEKAVKKQKLDEEVEELKKHLQIVPNDDDDDVYTEATPLALKVPILDYEIHTEHNKPYYKIIRADGTLQLFLSFLSLLRNFDKEDLEILWQLVKEIFASSKPKKFLDDFLLTTLKAMFKKPNVQAQVWKNQRGIHGLAKVKSWRLLESCGVHIITFTTIHMILLVEKRYPLTRITLDQILNNVRLEVKEESKVSLELLRFVRRQHQEGYRPDFGVDAAEDFKEFMLRDYYCWLKTYCCWYKLKLLDDAADIKLRLLEQSVAAGIR
uniref:Uncharacterized protein n=1 Tax=Tanacetum cinerariifolium TaxID=118510 RepID=A0A6L2JAF7_TANCI|nr:hypothetical protein [Tanacetum cinerariifolium]